MLFTNIILFGAPGSGKGTQSRMLSKDFNLFHLSTGDLLREAKNDAQSPFFQEINRCIESGELVSDAIINDMVSAKIADVFFSRSYKGIVFDGFPRSISQAKFLTGELKRHGLEISSVLYMRISEDEVVERVLNRFTCKNCGAVYNTKSRVPKVLNVCDECGAVEAFSNRVDDTEDVVKNRLRVFDANMKPMEDFYGDRIVYLDASLPSEEIFKKIKKVLEK